MTPPSVLRLRRLRRLLDQTLDLGPAAREEFLARLAREEPAAAREVAALLALEPALDAASFLSGATVDRRRAPARALAGMPIGRYILDRPLDVPRGTVWLARRRGDSGGGLVPVEVLTLDRLAPGSEARLQREGALLGRLDDLRPARLLDAGITGSGLPFLLLEFLRTPVAGSNLPNEGAGPPGTASPDGGLCDLVAVLGSAARDRRNRAF
jgi:hypothetical protein